MKYTTEFYIWILHSLFIIGILLVPVGLSFMLVPEKIFKATGKLNRWISTESFFNKINKPIYKEPFFYRHSKVMGLSIFVISLLCLYTLVLYSGVESIVSFLVKAAESSFQEWLFVVLYYLLIAAIVLTTIFGLIMYIRPSALKSFEKWGNRWIETEESLKVMDKTTHLPDRILPGNPRIFGFVVVMAAIYIICSTYSFI